MRNKITRTVTMVKYELLGVMNTGDKIDIEETRKSGYSEKKLIKETMEKWNSCQVEEGDKLKALVVVNDFMTTNTYAMDVELFIELGEQVNDFSVEEYDIANS